MAGSAAFKRVAGAVAGFLKQGVTPRKLAAAMAFGVFLGLFPLPGTTTAMCAVFAAVFRLNHAAIQFFNWLVYPVQLLLVVPWFFAGNALFGPAQETLRDAEIRSAMDSGAFNLAGTMGSLTFNAILAWAAVCLVPALLLFFALVPILTRFPRRAPASLPAEPGQSAG